MRRGLVAAALLAATACGSAADREPADGGTAPRPAADEGTMGPDGARTVRLFLAGDVMTGRGVDQVMAQRCDPALREPFVRDAREYVRLAERENGPVPAPVAASYVWGDALAVLERERPDASIVNLETSVTTSGDFWPGKGIHYRMHPANVACLAAARVDVCALANNHVLDFGRAGLVETLATLERAGIRVAGAGRDAESADRPVRIALAEGTGLVVVAVGTESSGIPADWAAGPATPGVSLLADLAPGRADEILARVRGVRRPGDVVVASIHWGGNWGYGVPEEHVAFAHRLVEGGVDVVHGHSSHHVRPVEVHEGKLILYGCGDLVNDYEGIGGHEEFRGDLSLVWLAEIDARDGALRRLRMVPTRMRAMRLELAPPADAAWLRETLCRIGARFGTRVEAGDDGVLVLRSAPRR